MSIELVGLTYQEIKGRYELGLIKDLPELIEYLFDEVDDEMLTRQERIFELEDKLRAKDDVIRNLVPGLTKASEKLAEEFKEASEKITNMQSACALVLECMQEDL